jgi:hypothetical protein
MPARAVAPPPRRHALGLPAGSVRALLAFMVLGLLWALAYFTSEKDLPVTFIYLQYLMVLILAHYFASHGSSIGQAHGRSPLGLPSGSVRLLLLGGFAGLVVFLYRTNREFNPMASVPVMLPLIMLSAFFVGYIMTKTVHKLSGGQGEPPWFQDILAWVALIAMIGLATLVLLHGVIHVSLPAELHVDSTYWETTVAAIVGFYFGARS